MFYYTKLVLEYNFRITINDINYRLLSYEFKTNSQYCYILKEIK